ncbi:MAG TPA: cyclic pyranopterin monophosphate synthase MoaC [Longimicrobiales bacterium]|nr:cyclic pyranopterin monophosphate synthase MoaC [Longimicrobiales bacterium]
MLTHLDQEGRPRMVDVSAKDVTDRTAVAEGILITRPGTLDLIRASGGPKGDPTFTASLAGIQAAKRTAELIPLCHPLPLTSVDVDVRVDDSLPGLRATSTVRVTGRTGVEMEALTAVAVALLTAYDMLKAVDGEMRIENVRLLRKTGGRSGVRETEQS